MWWRTSLRLKASKIHLHHVNSQVDLLLRMFRRDGMCRGAMELSAAPAFATRTGFEVMLGSPCPALTQCGSKTSC